MTEEMLSQNDPEAVHLVYAGDEKTICGLPWQATTKTTIEPLDLTCDACSQQYKTTRAHEVEQEMAATRAVTLEDWLSPNRADPTPQQTYQYLMGVSAESWDWWVKWEDPYDVSFFVDNVPVPNDWKVTGEIEAPGPEAGTTRFEITHEKIVRAAKEIAARYWHPELVKQCRMLLADADECDFDAGTGDSLLQYVVFGDIVYN